MNEPKIPFSEIYRQDEGAHDMLTELAIKGEAPTARVNEIALGVVDIVGRMLAEMEAAYQNNSGAKAFIEVCRINDEINNFIAHNHYVCSKYPIALNAINQVKSMSLFQVVFFMQEAEKAIGSSDHNIKPAKPTFH